MRAVVTQKLPLKISESLVSLIQSIYFRDFYIVTYLHDKIKEEEVVRELLKKFETYPHSTQQEFIPFLIFIATKFNSNLIKQWMRTQCQLGDTRLYLLFRWAAVSTHQISINESFLNLLDSSAINGKLTCSLDDMTEEEIHKWVRRKAERSNYMPILVELYHKLGKICLKLKPHPLQERNKKLRIYLQRYIKSFQEKLQQFCPNSLFGFTFPHPSPSNYVVNINLEECMCFSTKERVPYRLVFETIDYEELARYEQCEKGSGSTSEVSQESELESKEEIFADNIDNFYDLKTEERDLAKKMENYLDEKKNVDKAEFTILQTGHESTKTGLTNPDEEWSETIARLKQNSKFSHLKSLEVRSYIVKSGDDLRQEAFAMQLIKIVYNIFQEFNLKLWLRTYDIIMTSANSGFIEFIPNTSTISNLKKSKTGSLCNVFSQKFSHNQDRATINFVNSLAGYSILQHLFLIKDRHNGNILLDNEGHIIHIDFGFLLGTSPGNMGFETAPFKFPKEYLEIMGGDKSDLFNYFKELLFVGFTYIRRYSADIIKFITVTKEIVDLGCFSQYRPKDIDRRFMVGFTDAEMKEEINRLVYNSLDSNMTMLYDKFQYATNTIYY